jgi:chromosome segregation ATPase
MPFFRIRKSQQLAHAGQTFSAGAVVELTRKLAAEVSHLVDEVDAEGMPVSAPSAWEQSLETVREHERVSVLEQQLDAETRRLEDQRREHDALVLSLAQSQADLDAAAKVVAALIAALEAERGALAEREAAIAERAAKAAKKSTKTAPSGPPNPAAESAVPSKE